MVRNLALVAFGLDKNKFVIGNHPDCNPKKGTAKVDNGIKIKVKNISNEELQDYLENFYKNYKGKKKTINFKLEKIRSRYNYYR